jgi:hypothetical protein
MAEAKTKVSKASVADFIKAIENVEVREDCREIVALMEAATKSKGRMWGTAIVGFGEREVQYAGGKTAMWMRMGFSPRKQNIALYGLGISEHAALLAKLGKHETGKGCLYITRLSDVHLPTLKKLVREAAT